MSNAEKNLPTVTNETAAILSMIERVATDQNADIGKLEKMLDMQERVLNRHSQEAFSSDMAAMQSELPRVEKSAQAHNSKYARLEDINDAIRPILQKHGFAVTFRVNQSESMIKVVTVLSHRQGHREETDIMLPADTSGGKNAVQAIGSTISYGKRYGICALLNISTGDDTDGNFPSDDLPDITDAISAIDGAADVDELQRVFKEVWTAFKQPAIRKQLVAAKDLKKKELSK